MKKDAGQRKLDFSDKTTDNTDRIKTSVNNSVGKDNTADVMSLVDKKLDELKNTLLQTINDKLRLYQDNGPKLHSKKRNDRVLYVGDEVYPTFQKFKDGSDEPLKETLKKVARAAEKYLELTREGGKFH